jgi:mono/diheme cytochrome c family protein
MMNSLIRTAVIGALAFAAATAPAWGQGVGDPAQGQKLAKQVCADCHAVEKGADSSPEPTAPTFEVVANSSGVSAIALSVFLRTPHATMPNLVLTDEEIEDVIAYITSLKD